VWATAVNSPLPVPLSASTRGGYSPRRTFDDSDEGHCHYEES
jgi:hypothetical protein